VDVRGIRLLKEEEILLKKKKNDREKKKRKEGRGKDEIATNKGKTITQAASKRYPVRRIVQGTGTVTV